MTKDNARNHRQLKKKHTVMVRRQGCTLIANKHHMRNRGRSGKNPMNNS
uniref:Uncharacterized protein MANES_05G109900 n=1 Tax=Rhizophora mucronata TaxID=61149 RepID=A0A2P2LEB1_RHIMU